MLILQSSFIAFSTCSYTTWEDFQERIKTPLSCFLDIYKPPFFNRIGLRYIDVIDREELGLDNVSWTELLKPEILGMLSFSSADGLSVQSGSQQTELSLGETTMIVRSGLGTIDHDPRVCFIIDADTFKVDDVVNAGFADIDQILDELHAPVSTFFRQSITSMLHESMEPTDLRG